MLLPDTHEWLSWEGKPTKMSATVVGSVHRKTNYFKSRKLYPRLDKEERNISHEHIALESETPLAVVPSLPPLLAWVSVLLHHVKAFQMHTLEIQEPSEQIYHPIPLLVTPVRFSGKGIYTPLQDWNGYR